MPGIVNVFDPYERQARLYPMLLVVLPPALGTFAWLPPSDNIIGLMGGAFTTIALAAFMGQVVRDQGKKRESDLFHRWGGKPSVHALSFNGGYFDHDTIARIHRKINELDSDLSLPSSPEDEAASPERARRAYESANELLLSLTRDREQFRLVFAENMNYGYRRNLWAMKPAALVLAVLGVVASGVRLYVDVVSTAAISWIAVIAVLIGVVLTVFWFLRVNALWVRVAADAYARQLASAIQSR